MRHEVRKEPMMKATFAIMALAGVLMAGLAFASDRATPEDVRDGAAATIPRRGSDPFFRWNCATELRGKAPSVPR